MTVAASPSKRTDPTAQDDAATRAYRLLGGRKVLRRPVQSALDAHDLILDGLPSDALLQLIEGAQVLSRGDALEKAIGMSIRTFQRRKKDAPGSQLSTEQSSRTWRFAEILARAMDVMGSKAAAESWLESPAMGLDNRRPIDLLASTAGAEAVETYLLQMEYGVYV